MRAAAAISPAMPMKPILVRIALALLAVAVGAGRSQAQLVESGLPVRLTGKALARLVDDVGGKLREAASSLDADGAMATIGVADELGERMKGIGVEVGDRVDVPLQGFASDLQFSAGRLHNAAVRLRAVADRQRQCQSQDEPLFLSGIRTIAASLKTPVENFEPDAPYASSFAFEGLSTPLVVPSAGGRFILRGHDLWQGGPPALVLRSEDRNTVIAELRPSRVKDDHSLSATLDGAAVAANPGACLDLVVTATVKRDILFVYTVEKLTELHIPMCMPPASATGWMMSAAVGVEPVGEARVGLAGAKTIYLENSSCEERRPVSARLVWDARAPEDRLGKLSLSAGDLTRGNSSVEVVVSGKNAVTATGWLDKATCINGASGPKLLYSTVYQMSVNPSYLGKRATQDVSSAKSDVVATTMPQTQLCAEVPKTAGTGKTEWWYSLQQRRLPATAGAASEPAAAIYESPHLVATGSDTSVQSVRVGSYAVDAQIDPRVVNGKVKVCAVVKIAQQCQY
jgi:hypothetical protein